MFSCFSLRSQWKFLLYSTSSQERYYDWPFTKLRREIWFRKHKKYTSFNFNYSMKHYASKNKQFYCILIDPQHPIKSFISAFNICCPAALNISTSVGSVAWRRISSSGCKQRLQIWPSWQTRRRGNVWCWLWSISNHFSRFHRTHSFTT